MKNILAVLVGVLLTQPNAFCGEWRTDSNAPIVIQDSGIEGLDGIYGLAGGSYTNGTFTNSAGTSIEGDFSQGISRGRFADGTWWEGGCSGVETEARGSTSKGTVMWDGGTHGVALNGSGWSEGTAYDPIPDYMSFDYWLGQSCFGKESQWATIFPPSEPNATPVTVPNSLLTGLTYENGQWAPTQ